MANEIYFPVCLRDDSFKYIKKKLCRTANRQNLHFMTKLIPNPRHVHREEMLKNAIKNGTGKPFDRFIKVEPRFRCARKVK